jgi:hypothetical protein
MHITIDVEFDAEAYTDGYNSAHMQPTAECMKKEMKSHVMHSIRNRFEPTSYTFNAEVVDG